MSTRWALPNHPRLHSYAVGHYDNKWMMISGRTNGLHGFDIFDLDANFPAQSRNTEVWVLDLDTQAELASPLE